MPDQEVRSSQNIDRLIAGELFESELIKLLYEMDAGAGYSGFLICETGPGNPVGYLEEPRAKINELFESVGIKSRDWTNSLRKSNDQRDGLWKTITLSDREARGLQLEGVSIGEFFTRVADGALPIESGEDGDMYVQMLFDVSKDYILRLRADGSVTFIYPETDDEEDQESELEYGIKFEADILLVSS